MYVYLLCCFVLFWIQEHFLDGGGGDTGVSSPQKLKIAAKALEEPAMKTIAPKGIIDICFICISLCRVKLMIFLGF
jgi:hypothetical protein